MPACLVCWLKTSLCSLRRRMPRVSIVQKLSFLKCLTSKQKADLEKLDTFILGFELINASMRLHCAKGLKNS